MLRSILDRLFVAIFIPLALFLFSACDPEFEIEKPEKNLKTGYADLGKYLLYNRELSDEKDAKVILLTGLGGSTTDWQTIEPDLATLAHVLNYDREGLGKSSWQRLPKDSRTIATELHTLLQAKRIGPPYILMAHSLGGVHARVFASLYPNEVSGMVLLDPTPENLTDSLLATLPRSDREFILEQIRKEEAAALKQLPEGGIKEEFKAINTCYDQVRSTVLKTNVPVAVISSMKVENNDTPQSKEMAKRLRDQMLTQIGTTQKQHYTTTSAGHYVQKDQPQLVMDALKWVMRK
jgi:pimeloyl-ACP methyl ester carboxylesterase